MAKEKKRNQARQIGKTPLQEKKPLLDPKLKSRIETIVFLLVLLFFFVLNNTRKEPESGPYPPFYNKSGQVSTQ
ncbi:MAG: hypothetical protein COZ80_03200 [Ignavibacteria bacterium CG_4_8_14_3_um_filter_37_9]|nr:hypothetical protein [Ignavibacteria bacterium]OIO15155.1 MAG: hypothetical protein AUJ54_13085 [Ignavibacteria bacterium CG1_02_37_35]PIP76419.1 MAG: hypothetical protein COW85_14295 [Ignavibacteria bacterium CG22_combo_CG10-13_8_21_14_all_37_15]PIW99863.1 MAG: hypothetical protein COZ80_03200 [Ignavibacteria bacterium CG_4_8_14_3_um_filter_37_9]PIX93940.1 MAG: hypothetical protein COZ25_08095 [Ignavibacteria bacterium CG_4_10_14_3_um_filter_37_18]PJC59536.1 MAG: hypothetical protein CO025